MPHENFFDLVGNTPTVRYHSDELGDARIFIKIEGQNPTSSVKDRACVYNINGAIRDGKLAPGQTILDASSGNMACSLAYFGAIMGYKVEVVCSTKLTEDKAAFIRYFGAKLHVVGDFTIEGNRYCREVLMVNHPDQYAFLDQLHNWNNPQAHFETTGPEILREFPKVAAVIGSLGSGGTMNGIARYIKQNSPETKIVTVESESGTKIPGTGTFVDGDYVTPFIQQLKNENLVDVNARINLDGATQRILSLKRQGFYCGLQTGAVVEAAVRFIVENEIKGDVVVVSGDSGWKNMDKLRELC